MICILGGFVVGVAAGSPMPGAVIGTIIGAALAVALWLVDRRAD